MIEQDQLFNIESLLPIKDREDWKVLIVDDEASVHEVTSLCLESMVFEEKNVKLFSAYSGAEAKQILKKYPDIALVLLDVVMEDREAGLKVVKYIRNELKNEYVRIVLRTGLIERDAQQSVILEYDINDFREKSDLSPAKLFSAVYSALRAYAGLVKIQETEKLAKQQQKKLLQAEKMIALGTLVSGVAHEINNPNNLIIFNTPILKRIFTSTSAILEEYYKQHGDFDMGGLNYSKMKDKIPGLLNGIEQGANRIKNIVSDLKDFARNDKPVKKEFCNLNDIVEMSIKILKAEIDNSTNYFSFKPNNNLPAILGHSQKLEQVISNLIQNACHALENKSDFIKLSTEYSKKENTVVLTVEDNGVGISRENMDRVTDPFFSTKQDSKGTGLGLSISHGIIKDHGGEMLFESSSERGTKAKVLFPLQK